MFLFLAFVNYSDASACGCKAVRECYSTMLEDLLDKDEASCISDTSVGTSTVVIFLQAVKQYCPEIIDVISDKVTYEGRTLYEVVIKTPADPQKEDERPVFLIDAGQEAGVESVSLALFIIEQLLSCEENHEMISKVRWVIMPSTNPDGLEYSRYSRPQWTKNMRAIDDGFSFGVDVSRNFEGDWKSCPKVNSGFSPIYPGPSPASENETMFIQGVLSKYRKNIKIYLSVRRNGHSISYPHGFDSSASVSKPQLERVAGLVAARVNQRAGGIHLFTNQTIFEQNGIARCGHSVDYAHQLMTILHTYEMRVFLGSENQMMSKFQTLPRGYETTLRNGYYNAIKELYNIILRELQFKAF